ncbi:hypothetical protein PIB30_034281 [Stylosanthes scabra]|uniref:CRIB domain-containing protein n=1 Tax=Stylosanthes scabra TaxID=79078 RepID=A0ABU6YA39_9FABA|nr:hypothetical protein [Stylosanthes scabra]
MSSTSSNKVKGLLKGLRYISHMFEADATKDKEIQIGYPTDVKHVAHIGWDGPSVNSPSWMNEFKHSSPGLASSPLSSDDHQNREQDNSTNNQDKVTKKKESSDRPRQPRKSSKPKESPSNGLNMAQQGDEESTGSGPMDIPKKARTKRSKDASGLTKPKTKD